MNASFWQILLGMGIYGVVHSILAAHYTKDKFKKWLGDSFVVHYYRLVFNFLGVITFLPVLWLLATQPDIDWYLISSPWDFAAYGIQILALGCAGFTVLQTGAADFLGLSQPLQRYPAQQELNTGGFYKWVRHPLYTFSIIFLLASPSMTQNWAALTIGSILYFYIGAIYEERKLESFFGEAYSEYKKRTPMLIPRLIK
jgi:protein-S-isoprenylcysteine O-methyltransferase Ste14